MSSLHTDHPLNQKSATVANVDVGVVEVNLHSRSGNAVKGGLGFLLVAFEEGIEHSLFQTLVMYGVDGYESCRDQWQSFAPWSVLRL